MSEAWHFPLPNPHQMGRGFSAPLLSGKPGRHGAIDFGAPTGTPIYAIADGVVRDSKVMGGCGEAIQIRSEKPFRHLSTYCHCSQRLVKEGEKVEAGDLIGYVGSTGHSTSPHLHLAIWRGGKKIDPAPYLRTATRVDRDKELDEAPGQTEPASSSRPKPKPKPTGGESSPFEKKTSTSSLGPPAAGAGIFFLIIIAIALGTSKRR